MRVIYYNWLIISYDAQIAKQLHNRQPVYSGDFFQNMRTCQAWNMRGKYAKYAAELTLKRLLYQTVA